MIHTRRFFPIILALVGSLLLFRYHLKSSLSPRPLFSSSAHPLLYPANSTLGFGTILAVSATHSPRRASLLWAAKLTDISITIPPQPSWIDEDIETIQAKNGSSVISKGSALAWLGHLAVLRWFLATDHETALIIEDDIDWSTSIRQTQIPLLAAAVRYLLANTTASPSPNDAAYWGPTATWDLLYPGHCDDLIAPATYLRNPYLAYADATTPPRMTLHPDTSHFLSSLGVPSATRILHRAHWPFCTFAYAVTRRSAALILAQVAHESQGGTSAFDVALLTACRDDGWRCWSVSPELFHHAQVDSEIGRVDWNTMAQRQSVVRGTWNIACGARHPQLWVEEGDGEGRKEVKRLVEGMIGRGECAVDEVREERRWKGCEWGECGQQS